jgi:hypothetical protein
MADTSDSHEIRELSEQIALLQERLEVLIAALNMQAQDRAMSQAVIDRMVRDLPSNAPPRPHLTVVEP